MSGCITVRVVPDVEGRGHEIFSAQKPLYAKRLVDHLEGHHKAGTLTNAQGEKIFPDPEYRLEAGEYTFTLDQQDISMLFGSDGIASRNYTTRRTQKLYQGVDELGYLLIKAPPQSGKTSMLRLFSEWVAREHPRVNVLYINLSLEDSSFGLDDMFRKRLGGTIEDIMHGGKPTMVCIDEVQIAYHLRRMGSAHFWYTMKILRPGPDAYFGPRHQTRVVMAAAYGSSVVETGAFSYNSSGYDPLGYEVHPHVVAIFPSPSGLTLQLSDVEGDELWGNFTSFTRLQVDDSIKDHIFSICSRQPKLVTACLEYLEDELKTKVTMPGDISRNAWDKLKSQRFFDRMQHVQSIMPYADLQSIPMALDVMRQLVEEEPLQKYPCWESSAEAQAISKLNRPARAPGARKDDVYEPAAPRLLHESGRT